jgi:hypothetical protein
MAAEVEVDLLLVVAVTAAVTVAETVAVTVGGMAAVTGRLVGDRVLPRAVAEGVTTLLARMIDVSVTMTAVAIATAPARPTAARLRSRTMMTETDTTISETVSTATTTTGKVWQPLSRRSSTPLPAYGKLTICNSLGFSTTGSR